MATRDARTKLYRVGFLRHSDSARDFGSAAAVNNSVVTNQIADDAQSIMNTALGLLNNL